MPLELKKMSKIKVIAIIGRSASGKDTLVQSAVQEFSEHLHKVIHYTTRPMRQEEKEGSTYYFITEDELNKLSENEQILSSTCFNEWYYALGVNSFNKDKVNIGVFNPIELLDLLENYEDLFEFHIIETQAGENSRYHRSLMRLAETPFNEEGLKEMCRRNKADELDFKNIEYIKRKILYTDYIGSKNYNLGYIEGLLGNLV